MMRISNAYCLFVCILKMIQKTQMTCLVTCQKVYVNFLFTNTSKSLFVNFFNYFIDLFKQTDFFDNLQDLFCMCNFSLNACMLAKT